MKEKQVIQPFYMILIRYNDCTNTNVFFFMELTLASCNLITMLLYNYNSVISLTRGSFYYVMYLGDLMLDAVYFCFRELIQPPRYAAFPQFVMESWCYAY
jgi:hypothetical protein